MSINKQVRVAISLLIVFFLGGYGLIFSRVEAHGIISPLRIPLFQMMGLTVCLIVLAGGFVLKSYKHFFRKIIHELDALASRIDGSSYAIKTKGCLVLSGARRQTEAIAETARSHREIVEKIQSNARDVNDANELMINNVKQIETANQTLQRLIASMDNIKQATKNVHNIIDDINDIATKTNLLAINAGVESARAGEAGGPFAVIAGEVRGLALSSSTSARITTELIETTLGRVENGSETVNQMVQDFQQMAEHVESIKSYMAHIGQTAEEQAEKIRRLDRAVEELGSLAVENANNARDTDAISTALQANGEKLRTFISDIISQTLLRGKLSSDHLRRIIKSFKGLRERLGAINAVYGAHKEVLLEWRNDDPGVVAAIYSCQADGDFIYSNPPAGISNAKIRPWWQRAMAGENYISPVYISAIDNKPCRTISLPYYNGNGEVVGVVGADLKIG